eukprot:1518580-Rhodomonas_salina.1
MASGRLSGCAWKRCGTTLRLPGGARASMSATLVLATTATRRQPRSRFRPATRARGAARPARSSLPHSWPRASGCARCAGAKCRHLLPPSTERRPPRLARWSS